MFDTIQSEYGWSDKKILKLRIGRLVQIMAAIQSRWKGEVRLRQAETEWHGKLIAQFIIYTVEGEKSQKSLFKVLDKQSLINPKKAEFEPEADTTPSRGFNYADIEKTGNTDAAIEHNSRRKGGLGGLGQIGVTPS